MMYTDLAKLFSARELLWTWTMRDFKVRYSQSLLGAAWAILQPFSLMVIFSIIFSVFLKVPTQGVPYPVFAYAALLPWTFFSNALSFAIPSLVNNMSLVSKIYFPREILPFSAILVGLIDFLVASTIFILMLIFYRIPVGPSVFWVPLILLVQITLTFGVSLLASAVNVFYRDIRFVIPLVLQIWMYLSPVIYGANMVPEKYRFLYFLNPMAAIIDAYRSCLLFNQAPNLPFLGLAAVTSSLLTFAAYRYFKTADRQFADLI